MSTNCRTMRRFYTLLIVSLMVLGTYAQKREVRAVWLTTIGGIDWPHSYARTSSSVEAQKREFIDILDKLQRAQINTVLLQTRVRATTIYPSSYEPWDGCMSGVPGKEPGYDPLRFAIEECHRRGMELHAWIVTIPVGKWNDLGCKTLRKKYPKLIHKIGNEGYMNPGDSRTATYLATVCRDITERYDVDGIHLDYIRYPENWKVTIGKDRARGNITAIVRKIYDAVKEKKPWVKVSCAPIGKFSDLSRYKSGGWNAYDRVFQDVQSWVRMGIMDILFPMMYFKGENFYPFAIDWMERCRGRIVAPGLGIYFLDPKEGNWRIGDIEREMYHLRHIGAGYAFFRSKFFTDNTQGIYDFTSKEFNQSLALVPAMTWEREKLPDAPRQLTVSRSDSTTLVSWQPALTASSDSMSPRYTYYNIYASKEYPVDVTDAKNLVAIRRPSQSLFLDSPSDGFYYAVTAMDRYGNESEPLQAEPSPNDTAPDFLSCDGNYLKLPAKEEGEDADMLFVETLQGNHVLSHAYDGEVLNVRSLQEGMYVLRSVNQKGHTRRLGYFVVRRNSSPVG